MDSGPACTTATVIGVTPYILHACSQVPGITAADEITPMTALKACKP